TCQARAWHVPSSHACERRRLGAAPRRILRRRGVIRTLPPPACVLLSVTAVEGGLGSAGVARYHSERLSPIHGLIRTRENTHGWLRFVCFVVRGQRSA